MSTTLLATSIASGIIILVGVGFIVYYRLRRKGAFSNALGLGLLKIQMPPAERAEQENQKTTVNDVREKIAVMEQVFNQLATINRHGIDRILYGRPFFSLELVVPQQGQQVFYYLGVPRRYLGSAEKLVQGVYPDATIEISPEYSIFAPTSRASAGIVRTHNRYLPIKTYQGMESDPLSSILNAFSKIAHTGEGMSLQIICQRSAPEWNHKLARLTRHLRAGKTLSKALLDVNKNEFVKTFASAMKTESKNPENKPNVDEEEKGVVNENLVKIVESKATKTLFDTNIRLVAAAPTQERANQLLQELSTPFGQFSNEETNTISISNESARSLQKALYCYAFRIPDSSGRMTLSAEELSSIIHLPNTVTGAGNVAFVKAKTAPPPANLPREGLLLGESVYRGMATPVYMLPEDRLRHFYIIGQTGTGKTHIMRNMIIQDMEAGHGICFIDPHGDMAEEILGCVPAHRIKDVIYFNPGDVARPMGLNMLEYDPNYPEQKTFVINELLEIFNKLYDMKTAGGPMFEQYFRNATGLVMEDPESGNTLLEINRVFVDKKFRDYKLSRCKNPLIKTFWRDVAEKAGGDASLQNIVPYISSKFDSFLSNEIMRPIVSQERSAFKLREVMDSRKILLINLSKGRLGELNSSLIGLIMVGKILMAAFSRADQPAKNRKDFFLYADEFQNVATATIETILSEARKYRLGLVIAHQFIGQLEDEIKDAVFGNVGSLAAFRVGAEDGEFLEKQFGPTFSARDLINIDNRNCYVKMLIGGQTALPFNMRTLAGPKSDPAIAAKAKEYSRLVYGQDRAIVEEEMRVKFRAVETAKTAAKEMSPF